MAEKKTYKNPTRLKTESAFSAARTYTVHPSDPTFPHQAFAYFSEEWDVEVTFTKKEKPWEDGDVVYGRISRKKLGTVRAVRGGELWVEQPGLWGMGTFLACDVTREPK